MTKLSHIAAIIKEIVKEELQVADKTVGDTESPSSRFASEHPDLIKQMREWVKECQWDDIDEESDVDGIDVQTLLTGIQNNFDGGIKEFIRTSNSQAQTPQGFKENQSAGQHDDSDGYSNDSQRAFAHSQATTPRRNATEKAKRLAKSGKYVVLVEVPTFCKSTDACLGNDISIHHVANTRDEAAEEAQKAYKAGHGDYNVSVMGPEDLEPKKSNPTTPEDDVPFQEGVGYVYDKDMKKDPKHIPGERWRVKFEENVSKRELKGIIKELVSEMWYGSKNDAEGDETREGVLQDPFKVHSSLSKMVSRPNKHVISKPVKDTSTGEWVVKWMTNGKRDEGKTYYADDLNDANDTRNVMVKHADEMNRLGK